MKRPDRETTLDPEDWSELRALGHRMVDEMLGLLENVRDQPAWRAIPETTRRSFGSPAPNGPTPAAEVYEEFLRNVAPYPTGNIHPRFWGWVVGSGTPMGALAHLLAGTLNCNGWGGDQAAILVEEQVIRWMASALGFGEGASGILTGGGSGANLVGLTVARNAKAEGDVATYGVSGSARRMVLYASRETHGSVGKSAELLGLGSDAVHTIGVDSERRVDVASLRQAVRKDREAGFHPFCVVGNAGTVGNGAFDDLDALADLAQEENLWFHVDGAFGAFAALSPRLKALTKGMERADSLAVSLHKWLHVTYDAGCSFVKDKTLHHRAFTRPLAYMRKLGVGMAGGDHWFSEYGFELSRPFRALGAWMAIKHYGLDAYARVVEQNVEQASHLAKLAEASPRLELLAPAPLNVVCFRFTAPGLGDTELDALNLDVLKQLHESGFAVPSATWVDGRFALRVAITNHRTTLADVGALAARVVAIGESLTRMEVAAS
jgi:glutamate/tyrosine decarboxylase-like PLP-dependent enzyme